MVRERVEVGSVAWKLRTRLDAVPTLELEEGQVTAALLPGGRRSQPYASVEARNERMMLRALVGTEDLKVLLTRARQAPPGHYLDGATYRPVLAIDGDEALLSIDNPGAISTAASVPCSELGLMPNDLGTEALLPPARGNVVVKENASVKTPSNWIRVTGSWADRGANQEAGQWGELRGDDTDPLARLVSFPLCGATVLGWVAKRDLLGPPTIGHGANARCPNTAPGVYVTKNPLARPESCARALDVFLRSATLEDPVGVLAAGAAFQVAGDERGGTTLVRIEAPPADPFEGVSFSVRSADLEACRAPK
jgi:hypothetical protein